MRQAESFTLTHTYPHLRRSETCKAWVLYFIQIKIQLMFTRRPNINNIKPRCGRRGARNKGMSRSRRVKVFASLLGAGWGANNANSFATNPALSGRFMGCLAVSSGSRLFPMWSFSHGLWKDGGNCLNLFLSKTSKPTN